MSTSQPNKQVKPKPSGFHVGGTELYLTAAPDGKSLEVRGLPDPLVLSLDDARALSRFLHENATRHDRGIAQLQRTDALIAAHLARIRTAWATRGDQGGPDAILELREAPGPDGFGITFRDRSEAAALLVEDWKIASDKVKAGAKPGRITVVLVTKDSVDVRNPKTSETAGTEATNS